MYILVFSNTYSSGNSFVALPCTLSSVRACVHACVRASVRACVRAGFLRHGLHACMKYSKLYPTTVVHNELFFLFDYCNTSMVRCITAPALATAFDTFKCLHNTYHAQPGQCHDIRPHDFRSETHLLPFIVVCDGDLRVNMCRGR